ncbi:protein-L-isoaspartate O-methyltransferase [Candidatus Micrarchaeota archaeon]|nr:MAG: protein-L-isoaspartate O-methyltransferase [Candidatus Micrarchaeota archaeon]
MNSNQELVNYLLGTGYASEKIAKAVMKIDRADFVPEQLKQNAYIDSPLPIGHGQTISAPGVVTFMTRLLDVQEGMTVLEVGAGSGYQAAVLAELVGEKGKVITIERVAELVERAKANCMRAGYKNIEFIHSDGTKGHPAKAPYERIIVTAAARSVPKALEEQLAEGGKLVIPVGSSYRQDLLLIQKLKGELQVEKTMPVVFVPLIGEE